ncbi:Methanogenesis regulatory histidine kinase FilI [uncultured archaeon]|nr:Methanogenesis regulatory histidine kinase FilI [uncultured archaeon]
MTLRNKTIIIIGLTLLSLIIVQYSLSQIILIGSFSQLEDQDARKNADRVIESISDDLSSINGVASDWAAWDETYNLIEHGDPDYVTRNIPDNSFTEMRLNIMIFTNSSGGIVFERGFDIQNKTVIPVPVSLRKYLSRNSPIFQHEDNKSVMGIVMLTEGPMLIVSSPITNNARTAPICGSMIWGRYLNDVEIQRLAGITHLSLSVSRFDENMPADFGTARSFLSQEKKVFVQPISNEIIAGYIQLNDIEGNPAIIIKEELPRGIHKQGENTTMYLVFSIIGAGLVFGLVTIFLLEKNVLSRLSYLSTNMNTIGASGNHSMRVTMTGNDELSNLAKVINSMLEQLEDAEEANKKQLLLKEIYHRVKNNLQIVISLLNLQSQKTTDKNVIEIFKDSQNRIKSMAMIHERLYKSKDLAGINFKEYIQDLANNLFRSYGVNSSIVKLKIDVGDVIFNLDTATPCGLIVTELVSNSLKHAFPAGCQGEVLIRLHSDKNETFTLTIQDNGVGFPKDIDFRKTNTLGLQMVTSLVGQLKGTIELDRSKGTEFKITFKEKKDRAMKNE